MAKQLIILVHGMGTHPKGNMTKEFKKALTDAAGRFGVNDNAFLNKVDYQEFNYSVYFDAIRRQFVENAQARKKGFGYLAGQGFEVKLLQQLNQFESNLGKDEFFYTHWLDVILYSTMYFGEKVRIDFITLFEKLRKKYNHKNIHIVCTSLGTAVTHDALAKYYRNDSDPFDDIPDLKTGNFNIASLWTIANVSRLINLLNNLDDPGHSTVATGDSGCTRNFINVRHKYDPFTWFKKYDRAMSHKETFTNTVVRKPNTHDFYEYVTEPAVSRAMLSYFYGINVSDSKYKDGVNEHKKNTLSTEITTLKKLIDEARSNPSISSIKAAIEKFKKIQAEIERLIDQFEIA